MNKKIILCDMDGVVADFDKGILKAKTNYDFTQKEIEGQPNEIDLIVSRDKKFFQKLEPITDSIESVLELMKYYQVYFCSTPMEYVPHSFTGKKEWLNTHFGEKAYKNLILTHRKDLIIGDYLIDDRIKNGVDGFTGEHIHYGTLTYPNWGSILKYLIK